MDDIDRAKSTMKLFRPWIEDKERDELQSVKNFIDHTQMHFKPSTCKTIKNDKQKLVSIIILSYNTLKYTRDY